MLSFIVSALLATSSLYETFVSGATDNVELEMHNPLTSFKQCTHEDKEWYICSGYRAYCPTVLEYNQSQLERMAPCFTCPDAESSCEAVVDDFVQMHNSSEGFYYHGIEDELLTLCLEWCKDGKKGDDCSNNHFYGYYYGDSCTAGSYFCDFDSDDDFAMNISGTCKECPSDLDECYQDGFVTSFQGKRNCAACRLLCLEVGKYMLTVNGKEIISNGITDAIQKPFQNVSGPLIDCSNLLLESENKCPGAEGHVCIVSQSILLESDVARVMWQLSNVAEENGCIAIVINFLSGAIFWHDFDELTIPFFINQEDPKHLLNSEHNALAQAEVQLFGSTCTAINRLDCNIKLPCSEGKYCHYLDVVVDGEYTEGQCYSCPTFDNGESNSAGCFFYQDDMPDVLSPEAVKSCAKACNATVAGDDCEFCPSEVLTFDFGVEDKADQCYFCPNNDVQYPNKLLPSFGKNTTCGMVQAFFQRMEVHKDAPYCLRIQSMNHMCGCNGTGDVRANTCTKPLKVAWLPCFLAILSIGVSFVRG